VTSGFWSKEEILAAAYNGNKALFAIAVLVAFLTTFYMTRAFVITFLGKTRSENADHAHEVGPLMLIPLVALAGMAILSGFPFLSGALNAIRPVHEHGHAEGHTFILIASIASLVLGLAAGFVLYNGKTKDPLSIPLFRNRFYLDTIYDKGLVKFLQDGFAAIVHFLDELVINGLIVGGFTRLADSAGRLFTKAQSGNLAGSRKRSGMLGSWAKSLATLVSQSSIISLSKRMDQKLYIGTKIKKLKCIIEKKNFKSTALTAFSVPIRYRYVTLPHLYPI
jgi:NADH-quinone oxidoreductase subunit L